MKRSNILWENGLVLQNGGGTSFLTLRRLDPVEIAPFDFFNFPEYMYRSVHYEGVLIGMD